MTAARQRGQAAIIILMIVGFAIAALVFGLATPAKESIERDKKTADALARAKEALIGFATGVDLSAAGPRPGDLPCPDLDNTGAVEVGSDTPCSGAVLGRLPWRSLGLPDLRDGDGERLWYAVSSNFKNSPRTLCNAPGLVGCLNSDTRGTITIRDANGNMINNGNDPQGSFNPSGIIAVIIAPGAVLQRQGAGSPQDRSCAGDSNVANCQATAMCSSPPFTSTALCNPANYLDVFTGIFGTEDNSNFVDGNSANGFLTGPILDTNRNPIVNDRILTITYADLMPPLERRVAREAFNCLTGYAAASNGRYPWAAEIGLSAAGDYSSQQFILFGRMPDTFAESLLGLISPGDAILAPIVSSVCGLLPLLCMSNSWPPPTASPPCHIAVGSWWLNWKEQVFYGVADAYKPAATVQVLPPAVTVSSPGGCGNCLTVDPPSGADNKRFVVMVAGKRLSAVASGQPRSSIANKSDPSNYVEDANDGGATQNEYTQQSTTPTFNDILLYQQ